MKKSKTSTVRVDGADSSPVKKGQAYDESNIKVLKGVEAAKKRIGMYFGERGDQMVYRMTKELIDNCFDEAAAGRNNYIELYVNLSKNTYMVSDHAQGIPVGFNKEAGKSTLDIVFTELHGSGKFDNKAYSKNIGINGVGAACSNAVSDIFEVWTRREGVWYYRHYEKGHPVGDLKKIKQPPTDVTECLKENVKKYGTIIRFVPDQSIVSEDSTNKAVKVKTVAKLPIQQVLSWLQMTALMNPGLRIVVKSSKGKEFEFLNKADISAVVKKVVTDNELDTLAKPFVLQHDSLDCTFQWTSYDDTNLFKSYVNCSHTTDHGKHYEGFTAALGRVLLKHKNGTADDKEKKKPAKKTVKPKRETKKDIPFRTIDAICGLVGLINYKMNEPEFSSQTKDKLTSHVNKDVEEILIPALEAYFEQHKTLAATIIKRAQAIAKGRDDLKKVMKSVADVKRSQTGMLLPTVLASAPDAKPYERETYIVEGNSAGSTSVAARDPKFQEIFKLRGKLTNSMRTDMSSLLRSQVVQNMLVAFGVDMRSLDLDAENTKNIKFSTQNLRIGNVMILCDADTDGGHIAVLLLSAIHKLLPDLMNEGRVYIVRTPLFLTLYKGKRYFGSTLEECKEALPEGANPHITRAKGLGELDPDELYDVAFDPQKRKLYKVHMPKDSEALSYFYAITGSDSTSRKQLLGLEA